LPFDLAERKNKWQIIVSPDEKDGLMVHQQAWFSRADLQAGHSLNYGVHGSDQGIYLFVISGEVKVDGEILSNRDAIGLWGVSDIQLQAGKDAEVLLIEVPMK
jgi:quercetin 2,3-dioxygenase